LQQEKFGRRDMAIAGDNAVGLDITIFGEHPMVRLRGYLRPAPDLTTTAHDSTRHEAGLSDLPRRNSRLKFDLV